MGIVMAETELSSIMKFTFAAIFAATLPIGIAVGITVEDSAADSSSRETLEVKILTLVLDNCLCLSIYPLYLFFRTFMSSSLSLFY